MYILSSAEMVVITAPVPIDAFIRVLTDQNPFAHSLRPMDMMRQGWLWSFRQASQQ